MKKFAVLVAVTVLLVSAAGTARAQFESGMLSIRPEVGFGWADSFGFAFGGAVMYGMSDNMAFGPAFSFSTAGRSWKAGDNDTKSSNSMAFAGRIYYLVSPGSDYPWYVDAGVGIVKFGSVSEFDDNTKIIVSNEEGEIKGATCFAFNFGSGTIFPIGDNLNMVFDVNSYIGSHGDRKGKNNSSDNIDLNSDLEGGTFWLLDFSVGVNLTF